MVFILVDYLRIVWLFTVEHGAEVNSAIVPDLIDLPFIINTASATSTNINYNANSLTFLCKLIIFTVCPMTSCYG